MSDNKSTEEIIKDIILKVTRKPDAAFSPTTKFKDLEADSLDIVQILVALEDIFDIEIPDEEIKQIKNMGELVAYIEKKKEEKDNP